MNKDYMTHKQRLLKANKLYLEVRTKMRGAITLHDDEAFIANYMLVSISSGYNHNSLL